MECTTLRDPAVLEFWLHNLNGVILHIKVDFALPNPVFFFLALRHVLLEVCIKTQHLQQRNADDEMDKVWVYIYFLQLNFNYGEYIWKWIQPVCQRLPMRVPDYFLLWGKQNTLVCVSGPGAIHLQYQASQIQPTLELHLNSQNAGTCEIFLCPTINI